MPDARLATGAKPIPVAPKTAEPRGSGDEPDIADFVAQIVIESATTSLSRLGGPRPVR